MPLPVIEVPLYPAVPLAEGVPAVLRAAGPLAEDVVAYLTADGILPSAQVSKPVWGLFASSGAAALMADSTLNFEQAADHRVANYPTEQGGFQSYNKVEMPRIINLVVTKGGKLSDRQLFLTVLETLRQSLDPLTVITPEATYSNMNLTHYDYRRGADSGANMIIADVRLEEIRVTATAAFSNTADPSGAADQNIGPVQAQTPSATVSTAIAKTGAQ